MAENESAAPAPAKERRWEAAIPASILILRLVARRIPWQVDWLIVLSLAWILVVFLPGKKARTLIAIGAMILLFAIYLSRVLPHLVDTFLFCL